MAPVATIGGFPRPLLNISTQNFATTFNEAVGYELEPPFEPYENTINYLLASNAIPHVGLLVAELLGVESGEDTVLPTLLYERTYENVLPYNITVVQFTIYVSDLRNQVAMFGIKDKGLIVPPQLGAENRTESNTLSADAKFLVVYANPAGDLKDCLWN
ncbi:hypothetical protein AB3S75_026033 [Citrus x aurantiifolia]